ncbi:RpiB/LacA/LacB family sugar-phosphate isomerase [Ruminococcus gauvreauii]|uniref:RpiB/LacA/LacB family sugar-phosphate isomerase n=1 Tax=Ruminococcus gauvreauii TaxID=438033 RepID=UPI0039845BD1
MKIAMGCDPNAAEYKEKLTAYVKQLGHEVVDYGSDDPIYAKVAIRIAEDVAGGVCDRGIIFCGTGIGVSIAANKVAGAYAACVADIYQAQRAELSNHANIITIGAQVIGLELAKCFIKEYLSLQYDPDGRSAPKVEAIIAYEKEHTGGSKRSVR